LSLQDKVKKIYAVVADLTKKVGRTAYKELYRMRGIQMKMYPRWPAKQLNDVDRDELRAKLAEAAGLRNADPLTHVKIAGSPQARAAPGELDIFLPGGPPRLPPLRCLLR
jgi:hypothetical protein